MPAPPSLSREPRRVTRCSSMRLTVAGQAENGLRLARQDDPGVGALGVGGAAVSAGDDLDDGEPQSGTRPRACSIALG